MDEEAAGTIVGVCVAWCDGGQVQHQWIDIDKVQAIAWGKGQINERKANPGHGSTKVPTTKEPTICTQTTGGGAPVCWWTGSAWVCGEA